MVVNDMANTNNSYIVNIEINILLQEATLVKLVCIILMAVSML